MTLWNWTPAGRVFGQLRELLLDRFAGDGRVGPGALGDHQEDALLSLDPADGLDVLEGVLDLGHILQGDDFAQGRGPDGGPADVFEGVVLAHGPDEIFRVALDDRPRGQVDVFHGQGHQDFVQGDLAGVQGVLVDLDQDLARVRAEDPGRGDAVDPLQARGDVVLDQLLQVGALQRPGHPEHQDGHLAEAELDHQGIVGVLGQVVAVEP